MCRCKIPTGHPQNLRRSSRSQMFFKIGSLKMFAGKDLCENLFFKKTLTQVLSCDYFKIFNNSFFTRCNSNVNCDLEIMLGVYKSNITIMSFQRKRNKKFDVHVDLMFKLHLISNTFQISNFRFSLE